MSRVGHNSSSHKARNVHKQTRDDPTSKGEDQLSLDILSCHFYKVGRSWDDMEAYQLSECLQGNNARKQSVSHKMSDSCVNSFRW